jgi:hypothetical protein
MKNYELIAELSKYPAGCEIVFDSFIDANNGSIAPIEPDYIHVAEKITHVDLDENRILLA